MHWHLAKMSHFLIFKSTNMGGVLPRQTHFTFVTFKHIIFKTSCHDWPKLLLPVSIFTKSFKSKILQSFISLHLPKCFCHASQKTSMPPNMITQCLVWIKEANQNKTKKASLCKVIGPQKHSKPITDFLF